MTSKPFCSAKLARFLVLSPSFLMTPFLVTPFLVTPFLVAPVRAADARRDSGDEAPWRVMAGRIDELLDQRLESEGVRPADMADDAEFMRRVYLDLNGVIPTVSQCRQFLSQSPDAAESDEPVAAGERSRREQLIESLLRSPSHSRHLAVTWRKIMLPGGFDPAQAAGAAGLENWLRRQFADNLRYDRLVDQFLTSTGSGEEGPALFYTSQELKPERLASSTARIFLGLQIGCAECHDHPFDRWTQEDFWNYAAFFAQLEQSSGNAPLAINNMVSLKDKNQGDLTIPDSDQVARPRYPGGDFSERKWGTRRQQLSVWMASRDNPFLARAAVNWAWAHMFGRGLVEPVDEMGPQNPPSHPEVLDELSDYFVRTGFDLRNLLRTLANTRAYQRTSRYAGSPPPAELIAHVSIKSMTPEQLYDSVLVVTRPVGASGMSVNANVPFDPQRQMFISKILTQTRSPLEFDAGLPQALMLMNGDDVARGTDAKRSGLLVALDAPFLDDAQRLEILFLATLSRPPTQDETARYLEYVSGADEGDDRRRRRGDVLWALINSSEFALNH